ncbi:MAG TPA: YCF48-related protein [Candidatus Eisenbacteria bacterium]|nr:YCF48-related protein [Candidatus Eisenbacteria bacterium]
MIHPGRASVLSFIVAATLCASQAAATDYTFSWSNPKPQGNGLRGVAFENASVGYAVGRLGAVLRSTDGGATWLDRTNVAQFPVDLYDVAILSPGVLLAAGGSAGLYRSNDGGDTWSAVAHPVSSVLHNLHRLDATTLTAVGDLGVVLRSTDNGATWSALPSPGSFPLRDQFWASASDGYVCGLGVVRHTTNGGLNWTTLPGVSEAGVPEFHDVFFTDALNGWVLEHFATYRTTNGGVSWSAQSQNFPRPLYQHEGLWIDASTRYVITNLEGADVWKTVNDGQTWTLLYEHNNTEGNTDIDRLPDGTLVSVSSDGDLLRSTNAGATWQNFTLNPGLGERQTLNRMAFTPGGHAFAGGYGALWLRSDDAGASWTFGTPAPPGLGTTYEIEFLNDALGFAGGVMSPSSPSRICRTVDGGVTWTAHTLANEFGWVHGISIVDAQTQFAVTYGGDGINKVFRSTDGGATWPQRGAGLPLVRVECVQFLDANVGYAGGGASTFSARVIKTIDAGATWTPLAGEGLLGGRVVEMHWFDATHAVAAGDGGVFRTTDGGASWSRTLAVYMDDLDFRDALHGFTCNYSPAVWQTSDGGQTWSQIPLPWTGGPTSIEARPDGFVVCGLGSVILAAHEAGVTGVPAPEPAGSEPAGIAFAPNPTTGSLQMRFVSGMAGVCEVSVYDAAGRRVASFRRAVGRGPVALDWRARGSGIHFVSVRDPAGVVHNGRFLLLR